MRKTDCLKPDGMKSSLSTQRPTDWPADPATSLTSRTLLWFPITDLTKSKTRYKWWTGRPSLFEAENVDWPFPSWPSSFICLCACCLFKIGGERETSTSFRTSRQVDSYRSIHLFRLWRLRLKLPMVSLVKLKRKEELFGRVTVPGT